LISNDPAALPPKSQVIASPAIEEAKPKESSFTGLKKILGFGGTKPEELTAPVEAVSQAAPPATSPTPSPASVNMEGLKPYEPPSLLNSLQQLFN
jgi:hypothetical protein